MEPPPPSFKSKPKGNPASYFPGTFARPYVNIAPSGERKKRTRRESSMPPPASPIVPTSTDSPKISGDSVDIVKPYSPSNEETVLQGAPANNQSSSQRSVSPFRSPSSTIIIDTGDSSPSSSLTTRVTPLLWFPDTGTNHCTVEEQVTNVRDTARPIVSTEDPEAAQTVSVVVPYLPDVTDSKGF